jgi:hypothetical protein
VRYAPAPGEPAEGYIQQLENLGLQPRQTSDAGFDIGNVDATDPSPGTRMLPGGPINVQTKGPDRNRCEDHPGGQDPDSSRGTDNADPRLYEDAPSVETPGNAQQPFATVDGRTVHLRYGYAKATSAIKNGYPVVFWGWGWRKIYAKHGWDASDVASTREALAQPTVPPFTGPSGNPQYLGPDFQRNGELCQRVVAVDNRLRTLSDGTTQSRDIVTSYTKDLGPADVETSDPTDP